jgi:TonB family protein
MGFLALPLLLFTLFLFPFSLQAQLPTAQGLEQDFDTPPFFEGCFDPLSSLQQQQTCSNQKLLAFLRQNLQYPPKAKEAKLEGLVVLSLIIDQQGEVVYTELLRDLGSGCGTEALRIARQLPRFSPAQKKGQAVKCRLILPIRFQLQTPQIFEDDRYQLLWGSLHRDSVSLAEVKAQSHQPIIVRNAQGEQLPILQITFVYIHKKKVRQAQGSGNQLNEAMLRHLRRARKKSYLVLTVTVQDAKTKADVVREWVIE